VEDTFTVLVQLVLRGEAKTGNILSILTNLQFSDKEQLRSATNKGRMHIGLKVQA
jgi:hypothetical protein